MESSQRDLFIDMVIDRFTLQNNKITLSLCFTFISKTGVGLPKTGASFYCVTNGERSTVSRKASDLTDIYVT